MHHNRKYLYIAKRLIRTLPEFADIAESEVRIAFLSSYKAKVRNHKVIFAECNKVDDKYSWCCKYDFFIVVYEPNIEDFTEDQIEILIRHELHHVGIDYDKDDEIKYYVVPHDVEEFWEIINQHGLKWSDTNATGDESEQPKGTKTE